MPIPGYRPIPAPSAVFRHQPLPETRANWLSRLTFQWVTPILRIGYSRPIEAVDLWDLNDELKCEHIADRLWDEYTRGDLAPMIPRNHGREVAQSNSSADEQTQTPPKLQVVHPADVKLPVSPSFRSPASIWAIPSVIDKSTKVEQAGGSESFPTPLREQSEPDTAYVPPISHHKAHEKAGATRSASDGPDAARQCQRPEDDKSGDRPEAANSRALLKAMYHTVKTRWWVAVGLKLIGAILQVTAPLVTRLIIQQITIAHTYHQAEKDGRPTSFVERPKSVAYGVGLAIGLFGMLMFASLLVYQALQIGSVLGFMMRSALIDLIGRKSMALTSRSRQDFMNGQLTTMVSADASYLDFSAPMTVDLVVQPIQILVGLALIIYTLGYSALVGLAVLCFSGPIQAFMFAQMVKYRQLQLKHIDARVKLLSEVIDGIRSVKLYAYTELFGAKVKRLREEELAKLKVNGFNRATMNATMSFIPILAAVLTFITYGLTGHTLDAATIFTGLQFFNVLKTPISFLPICFAAVSDAFVAIRRIETLLRSEQRAQELNIDPMLKSAIDVRGHFTFENRPGDPGQHATEEAANTPDEKTSSTEQTFQVRHVKLNIPRGAFVCVIGRVGTGKSALMQGLLGEMTQTAGHTVFSGPVSYVPQDSWVHSGTVRDNITFSANDNQIDHARLDWVIDSCCLREDLVTMTHGLSTPVGARGISLSGGQRQRLALARAAYDAKSSIVLMDDSLSAIDAHVSHQILRDCILQGPMAGKTRVLVTHNLEVLPKSDWVIVMDREGDVGRIVQQGTYTDLCRTPGVLRDLFREIGRPATLHSEIARRTTVSSTRVASSRRPVTSANTLHPGIDEAAIVPEVGEEEERQVGAVNWTVYINYIRAAGSWTWVAVPLILLAFVQGTNVALSLFLGWWSADKFKLSQNLYMAIYASLGLGIAIFTWSASFLLFLTGIRASYTLFNESWTSVLRAKVSWLDKTPSGRIVSRLSKDIEALDDRLATSWEQFLTTALAVFGTFGLILYVYPYLGLAFIPLTFFYYLCATFYRQTSREVKRVDSITRSHIYESFGEQLDGRVVISASGQKGVFQKRLQVAINKQCQAYIITLTIQRWLGIRLDFFSNILVMLIAMFGSWFRNSVSAQDFGIVLTYTLAAAQLFANLVSLYAQVEIEMNNAERVLHYANDIPLEPPSRHYTDPVPPWPVNGHIIFDRCNLRYGPTLPLVLRELLFEIEAGEKIGVIGRTGAGKSSLVQALFRMVELESGTVSIDGRNIAELGVDVVREGLAVIPQFPFLFEGTIRENIDPVNARTDAELNSYLQLVHADPAASPALKNKLRLDGEVAHEGSNFSAGERQLIALVRALVKGSKVMILDEATSSVDPETDALVQRIIQTRFKDITLISIAHRLHTVASFDKILVMDSGQVAEFDTPLTLYDQPESIFRSLCDRVKLRRSDLVRARGDTIYASEMAADRSSLWYHYTTAQAFLEQGPRYSEHYPLTPPNSPVSDISTSVPAAFHAVPPN